MYPIALISNYPLSDVKEGFSFEFYFTGMLFASIIIIVSMKQK